MATKACEAATRRLYKASSFALASLREMLTSEYEVGGDHYARVALDRAIQGMSACGFSTDRARWQAAAGTALSRRYPYFQR